jgi:hypothetical protein
MEVSMSLRLVMVRGLGVVSVVGLVVACSNSSTPVSGAASASGESIGTVRSAALITSAGVIDGASTGTMGTYVEFLTSAPGVSCAALTADAGAAIGSLQIAADPSTLAGKTVTLGGSSPSAILSFTSPLGLDASADGGASQALFSVSGSATVSSASGSGLAGNFNATMSLGPTAATTVKVTGDFTAPSCGEY